MSHFEVNKTMATTLGKAQENMDTMAIKPVLIPDRAGSGGFPAQYQSTTIPNFLEREAVVDGLKKLDDDKNPVENVEKQVVLEVTDEDVKSFEEKGLMEDQLRFDAWLAGHYDQSSDPSLKEWFKAIYPEFFEARKNEKNELHKVRSHIEDIMLYGPETKDDLFLLFRLNKDPQLRERINALTGYQEAVVDTEKPKIKRGLLNPHRLDRNKVGNPTPRGEGMNLKQFVDSLGKPVKVNVRADGMSTVLYPEIQGEGADKLRSTKFREEVFGKRS